MAISNESGTEGPFDEAWKLTEAEFEKANERLTPEVLQSKDAILAVFVDLLQKSAAIAQRLIPEQDRMKIYNALYEDMMWNGSDDEEICELVNETAYEAEDHV